MTQAFEIGCDILSILTSKQGFVSAVAEEGALWRLLWILERPGGSDDPSSGSKNKNDLLKKQKGWTFFESLSSSASIAPKILESSAWLELLGILVGYSEFTKVWIARTGAAKILSRLLWDPKTGVTLGKFETKCYAYSSEHRGLANVQIYFVFLQHRYWDIFSLPV